MRTRRTLHILLTLVAMLALTACSGAEKDDPDSDSGDTGDDMVDMSVDVPVDSMPDSDDDMTTSGYDGLVINEVAPAGEPDDWFELYNGSSSEIDLSGVYFTDDIVGEPTRAVFQEGTTIPANGYHVVYFDMNGPDFGLGSDEELGIYEPDGSTLIDSVDWDEGQSPDGTSLGRIPNGTGEFKTLGTPTPGEENVDNSGPVCGDGMAEGDELCDGDDTLGVTCMDQGFVGGTLSCQSGCMQYDTSMCEAPMNDVVINEVTSTDDDNIELYNNGNAAADMSDWFIVDSGYNPQDPEGTADHRYDFAPGTMLEPGTYLVLVKDVDHAFGLGDDDIVILYDGQEGVVDQTSWLTDAALVSWCRIPNGTGEFQGCSQTFGAENMP